MSNNASGKEDAILDCMVNFNYILYLSIFIDCKLF